MNKRNNLIKLALIAFVGLFVCGAFQTVNAQSRADQLLINRAENISGDKFRVSTRTSRGVRIIAVNKPNAAMLNAIDRGFAELFSIARRHGYNKRLNFADYTVFIAHADRKKDSAGNYSPDLAVPAGQYGGSVYDQGGFIYAAGMVAAFNPSAFLIAEHEKDLKRVSTVVRYEGEHIVLYYNDRDLYRKTEDHSKGGGHPILQ